MSSSIRTVLGALVIIVLSNGVARATDTVVGVGAIVVTGQHRESGASAQVSGVPAPLLWARHDAGRFEFFAEGIPPIGTVPISNNGLGLHGIQLTYLDGIARYHLTANTTAGIGETIYAQQSTYQNAFDAVTPFQVARQTQTERSRLVGAQYQVMQTLRRSERSTLQASVAFNPHLSANLGDQDVNTLQNGTVTRSAWFVTPESGSQIDASIENDVREGKLTLRYGLRYLNLVMRFPSGQLADQNAFLAPFAGVSIRP